MKLLLSVAALADPSCKTSTPSSLPTNNMEVRYVEESSGNVIPYIAFESASRNDEFYRYTICDSTAGLCTKEVAIDSIEAIYGLPPGRYAVSGEICDKTSCKPIAGQLALTQDAYSNNNVAALYSSMTELDTYSAAAAASIHKATLAHHEDLKTCLATFPAAKGNSKLQNYLDYYGRIAAIAATDSDIFTKQVIKAIEPVLIGVKHPQNLSLTSGESRKWKVTMYNFNFPNSKPIFSKLDGKWRFDLQGLKQSVLGGRYGHSAILIGDLDPDSLPADGSNYISWPRGDDFTDDARKYKTFKSQVIGYIDDTQKAAFDVWLKKTSYGMREDDKLYRLYDDIDELADKLANKLGQPWDDIKLKSYVLENPKSFKEDVLDFLSKNGKQDDEIEVRKMLGQYDIYNAEVAKLQVPLTPEAKAKLESSRQIAIEQMRGALGLGKGDNVEVFVQKNWEGLEAFENSPNANHPDAAKLEERFDKAFEKLEKIDAELYRPRTRYGVSYDENRLNCSHVSGMCADVAFGEKAFYRKRFFPADPQDNLVRARRYAEAHLPGDPQQDRFRKLFDANSNKAKYVAGTLAIGAAIAAGAYFLYDELKLAEKSLEDKEVEFFRSCVNKAASQFSKNSTSNLRKMGAFLDSRAFIRSLLVDPSVTAAKP